MGRGQNPCLLQLLPAEPCFALPQPFYPTPSQSRSQLSSLCSILSPSSGNAFILEAGLPLGPQFQGYQLLRALCVKHPD